MALKDLEELANTCLELLEIFALLEPEERRHQAGTLFQLGVGVGALFDQAEAAEGQTRWQRRARKPR